MESVGYRTLSQRIDTMPVRGWHWKLVFPVHGGSHGGEFRRDVPLDGDAGNHGLVESAAQYDRCAALGYVAGALNRLGVIRHPVRRNWPA